MARAIFLDRDGVINEEKKGSYIFHKDEFVLYNGALHAMVSLSQLFDYLIIVTNQRGIGRGLMTTACLQKIHEHLATLVKHAGGNIHAIYFAPSADLNHSHRKPNIGMALDAKQDFPDINFQQSVMVGNNLSDMIFGKKIGMETVFLHTTNEKVQLPHDLIDKQFASLEDYANFLIKQTD